ncbi:hypothetical protein BO82DRAFT_356953 [Aspergillus uvarum CBS 121591]|uniref:Uncharacterized protein n=1 Tax=Aspergillus uvarum CBS 121591 TaxID=1448315 RepID=A0A319C4T9_9EURO|nr:hypothetical protein BO82DRAFT_356953 [Aspergillus uvarum CBS 121591]PYH78960.1 hypothetical protein BO82DRAFT_356953 [Aspergillus uvarum CBS 121591]
MHQPYIINLLCSVFIAKSVGAYDTSFLSSLSSSPTSCSSPDANHLVALRTVLLGELGSISHSRSDQQQNPAMA